MTDFEPAYIRSNRSGLLKQRVMEARRRLRSCCLCPRRCNVDRTGRHKTGVCNTFEKAWVSSFHPHFGEEAPLVGLHGSGTVFFTHCNLLCNFCQNYDISHLGVGHEVTDAQLASMMLSLQNEGCHNINFVTPSHVVPMILSAVEMACTQGLTIPLVYNSGGYDRVETLRLLDGVFDIYMPDFKFWDLDMAEMTCHAPDYAEVVRKAIREMYRQVGDLVLDKRGIAQRGLLVRHLVLPEGKASTREIMRFISREISTNTYVNIMSQYRPCGSVTGIKPFHRSVSRGEFMDALSAAKAEGITRLD
ncbi:radical SAM protein [Thermodesulfobacteriota bacterium]